MDPEEMSEQDLRELALVRSALRAQSWLMKWMVGGFVGMILGAGGVGAWITTQQHQITELMKEDERLSSQQMAVRNESSELRGQVNVLYKDMAVQRQEIALQGQNIQFIREKIIEVSDSQKKLYESMARP